MPGLALRTFAYRSACAWTSWNRTDRGDQTSTPGIRDEAYVDGDLHDAV